jgi:pimeloyl-ACP methyl ester carboxylesterase
MTLLMDSLRLKVAGAEISARAGGSGPSLLFLDGGDGFHRSQPWLDRLSKDWSVVAPRYPGYGDTPFVDHVRSVSDLALLHLALMEELDLSDTLLVGASFGGWIAAEIAVRSCHRIKGLVLIDPLGIKLGGPLDRSVADIYARQPGEQKTLLYASTEHRLFDYTSFSDEIATHVVKDRTAEAFYGWRPSFYNPTLKEWLRVIKRPCLVIWGADDGLVSTEYGRAYAGQIPGAEFQVVDRAGHYPHVEQPEATYALVRQFVDGLS